MITIYTTQTCPYCVAAKKLLGQKGIPFKEIDVSKDEDFDALVQRTGWKTVPQIFIGDQMIGGYQELVEMDATDQLLQKIQGS